MKDLLRARAVLAAQPEPSLAAEYRQQFDVGLERLARKAHDSHIIAMFDDAPAPRPSRILRAAVAEVLAYAEQRRTAAINYARHMSSTIAQIERARHT